MAESKQDQFSHKKAKHLWSQVNFNKRLNLQLGRRKPQNSKEARAVQAYGQLLEDQQPLLSLAGAAGFMVIWVGLAVFFSNMAPLVWVQAVVGGLTFGVTNFYLSRFQARRLQKLGQNFPKQTVAEESE